MKTRSLFAMVCVAIGLVCLASQASAQGLRVGDSFDLRIGGVPPDDSGTISQNYTIDGEGCMNISYLGKLHVAGMTTAQIQSLIERSYVEKGIFTHPTITLGVQSAPRYVNVSGAVKNPSRIAYTPDMTLMSAINAANDFNDYADPSKVRLIHGNSVKVINCKKLRKDPSQDPKIEPGDSIQVPEGFF